MNYSDELDMVLKDELTNLINVARKKEEPFDKGQIEKFYKLYKKKKNGLPIV